VGVLGTRYATPRANLSALPARGRPDHRLDVVTVRIEHERRPGGIVLAGAGRTVVLATGLQRRRVKSVDCLLRFGEKRDVRRRADLAPRHPEVMTPRSILEAERIAVGHVAQVAERFQSALVEPAALPGIAAAEAHVLDHGIAPWSERPFT